MIVYVCIPERLNVIVYMCSSGRLNVIVYMFLWGGGGGG